MTEEWLVRLLFLVLGAMGGVTAAMAYLSKKLTEAQKDIAVQARDIETAQSRIDQHGREIVEALHMITKVVDQNNLLIQKLVVEKT